jgi:hypothetical protein
MEYNFKIDLDNPAAVLRFCEHIIAFLAEEEAEPKYPENHGKSWDAEQDGLLVEMVFDDESFLEDIAKKMGRTPYAIECRLNHVLPTIDWEGYIGPGPGAKQNDFVDPWIDRAW